MRTAAKVAEHKRKNPELYCKVKNCLWREITQTEFKPCRKHSKGCSYQAKILFK